VSIIKEKTDGYYCSNCMMRVGVQPICPFCGNTFSNYEDIILANYHLTENQKYDIIYSESEGK